MSEMNQKITASDLFNLDETIASQLFQDVRYPWEVLPLLKAFIMKLGKTLPADEYDQVGENIWIAKSAHVFASAYIDGPAIIGKNAEIRHCAFIRGSVIVGEGAVVGNSSELKNSLLFNQVHVPHYNYVGDSILGFKAHMGAGAITSNVKSDSSIVVIHGSRDFDTGLKKVGAMLGDYVEVGCNSVLNPGAIVGRHSSIYPLSMVRGIVTENSIYKAGNDTVKKALN